ncbi:type IV secretion protein Rhs [Catellatospora sp. TT07R-123]|uniref:RHS repeat-associated core domain-containing protein n=1 Tax=Catellatospora sp. TT07R-123 TaxID=2733863 RepID=UPI001B19EDCB|nr:RHS repeat-associated core domain-containing protein [Catellatospora sp. TT07R-123]GHJ43051.1 type IV secretion protein Rhs [Catellatospora sp. TT07R-123]
MSATTVVNLTGAPATRGASVSASPAEVSVGGLQLRLSAAASAGGKSGGAGAAALAVADVPKSVRVQTVDHAMAERAGAGTGFVVARGDGGTAAATLNLRVDYRAFAHGYGGDFGARLRPVLAPACALTTPDLPQCATRTPLVGVNDTTTQAVTATVDLAGAAARTSGLSGQAAGSGAVVLLAASAASETGAFTKTPLAASMSWQAGTSGGGFSTTYPLAVPPVAGGLVPPVAFTYSSSAVDGRTNAESAQTSWLGEGWSYEPGYIERSYRSCAQDHDTTRTYANDTGDLCWNNANATLVWAGRSTELVLDSATQKWKLGADDGSKIDKFTGPGNWGNGAETWRITTPDGTEYYFGLNRIKANWQTGDPETNSTLNVPVFANHATDPCYQSGGFSVSWCWMTWRWNLDYVVDPNGNTMVYTYYKETPKTGINGSATNLKNYDRAAYIDKIEYGMRKGTEGVGDAPALVDFILGDRCLSSCWSGANPVVANWPDTPWDLNCPSSATSCPDNVTPSFWGYKRLSKVVTSVVQADGTGYDPVDEWTLDHVFPDSGETQVAPAMWLNDITRTGKGTATPITVGNVHFSGYRADNKAGFEGGVRIKRYRLRYIDNETGGRTAISYELSDCATGTNPNPDHNTKRCFPQYYTPPDSDTGGAWTWWNKLRVTSVTEQDFVGGQPDVVRSYEYWMEGSKNGAATVAELWHHTDSNRFSTRLPDRSWADFRGWPTVVTTVGSGTGTGHTSKTKQLFFRGMNGDRLDPAEGGWGARTVNAVNSEGHVYVDSDYRAGFLYEEQVIDPDTAILESKTLHYPWGAGTGTRTITGLLPPTQTSVIMEEDLSTSWTRVSSGSPTWRISKTKNTWDATLDRLNTTVNHGLVTVDGAHPFGVDGAENDETCTTYTYAATAAAWMTDRVATQVTSSDETCPGLAQATTLAATRNFYDAQASGVLPAVAANVHGLLTRSEKLTAYPVGGPTWVKVADTTYDALGRPVSSSDAVGRQTTTTYTPAATSPLTAVAVTRLGAAGSADDLTTTTGVDRLRGLPLTVTDPNGKVTTSRYDALGRLTKVWRPGRVVDTDTPDVEYTYFIGNAPPYASFTATRTLTANGTVARSYDVYDGLLRPIHHRTVLNSGTAAAVTDTVYNDRGTVDRMASYEWASSVFTDVYATDYQTAPRQVRYTYDGLGRAKTSELWTSNGTTASKVAQVSSTYTGDQITVDQPAGGTDTTTVIDVLGRTVQVRQYVSDTASGSADTTTYGYDLLGRLTTVTDAGSPVHTWTYAYDLAGRRKQVVDPDAGTSTVDYYDDDQVKLTTDGRGRSLYATYDMFGRITATYDGTGAVAANQLTGYQYDTVTGAKGYPATATRYVNGSGVGGSAYLQKITAYDVGYRPLTVQTVIPAVTGGTTAETALAGTYTTTNEYKVDGAPYRTTMPAIGGLPAETLTYGYNSVGQLTSVISPNYNGTGVDQKYVADTAYTYDGLTAQQILGNPGTGGASGKQVQHTYTYDDATRRLTKSAVKTENQTSAGAWVDRITDTYTLNHAGDVTSIAGTTDGVADQEECFGYDYLRRLSTAWTQTSGACVTGAAQGTGADPYWTSWTFDKTGNRLSETSYNPGGTEKSKSVYDYTGSGGPHVVNTVTTTGTGAGTTTFTYDAMGNRKTRATSAGASQTLDWDAEGRLASATGSLTGTVYNTDGGRLLRKDADGKATLKLPDGTELVASGTGTVTGTRYHAGVAVRTAVTGGTALTWVVADHHGTGTAVIDAVTMQTAHRRSLPYGGARGTQPGGFGTQGFVGGTNDPNGLVHLGVREYDPETGRFISVDPVFDITDPQSWNGFAYANNAPTSSSDPTGLIRTPEDTSGPPPDYCTEHRNDAACGGGGREETQADRCQRRPGFCVSVEPSAECLFLNDCTPGSTQFTAPECQTLTPGSQWSSPGGCSAAAAGNTQRMKDCQASGWGNVCKIIVKPTKQDVPEKPTIDYGPPAEEEYDYGFNPYYTESYCLVICIGYTQTAEAGFLTLGGVGFGAFGRSVGATSARGVDQHALSWGMCAGYIASGCVSAGGLASDYDKGWVGGGVGWGGGFSIGPSLAFQVPSPSFDPGDRLIRGRIYS